MLSPDDTRRFAIFQQRLQAFTPVSRLAVYGSRARGDADAESDLDLYIEVPRPTPLLRGQIRHLAWEISLSEDCVITTFVTTPESVASGPLSALPVLRAIEEEGVFA